MPKLQMIKRVNGSLVYSVNIPLEIIEELGWKKGAYLSIEISLLNDIPQIIIFEREAKDG